MSLYRFAAAAMSIALTAPIAALAQQSPLVRGVVVNSDNNPISNAEVSALDSTSAVVATTHTDKHGAFTLQGVAPKVSYIYTARQVGFARGASKSIKLRAIDTLNLHFALERLTATLPNVTVLSAIDPDYRIDAAEIAKHPYLDALDVVLNLRPRMLGDAYKECRPDTSHLTIRPARFSPILPTLAGANDTLGRLPPSLYINGRWHGELGMKDILAQIPAADIDEMRYVDCYDTKLPSQYRNALFVILKPGVGY